MILVIDLGTSYFKTSLFGRDGRLHGVCRLQTPIRPSADGLVEIDIEAFESTIAEGFDGVRRECGSLDQIQAVTFATQTNSIVLLDDHDRPLTPLILWPDRRAADLEDELRRRSNLADFRRTTGIPQLSHQFMVARLMWFQRHEPGAWAKLRRLCLISDYLTMLLCGRHVTEAGAMGLSGLVDIHRLAYWPAMREAFSIDAACLPGIVRAGTDAGPLDPAAARRFGLPAGCRMVVGCLDQYAGAIGAGNFEPGSVSETTGTVLATVRCTDRFATDLSPEVFVGPAFADGLYYEMVFGELSANYLEWYRDQLVDRPSFEELGKLAEQSPPGAHGLRLRTGVPLTRAEEVFEGLDDSRRRGDAVRCIMEGVAIALRDQVRALAGDARPSAIHCAGGAARSDVWLQIKADVLNMATMTTQCQETVGQGAAVLAEAALSGRTVAGVAREWIRSARPHRPDPERHSLYNALRSA